MARKKKSEPDMQAKEIESLTKRVAALEHKAAGTSMAAWLAAFGTTLSGLGAVGFTNKPAAPLPPTPAPIQESQESTKTNTFGIPQKRVDPPSGSILDPIPAGSPPEIDHLIDALDQSKLRRELFRHAVRETELKPSVNWSLAYDPAQASRILIDPNDPADLRAMSALYLGALGDRRFEPALKSVNLDSPTVGKAAALALTMLDEGASPEPKPTLIPPASTKE